MASLSANDSAASTRRARSSAVRAAVPLAADARDSVAAVLRWRAWWLGHHLPGRLQAAARLFPVMLQTSFPVPELSGEAPGVAGLRFRRRWSALARAIGLPPPNRMQRGRSLVETVLAVPTPDGLEVLALVSADARPDELRAVEDRVQTARAFLTAAGAPLRAGVLPPSRLAADVGAALRTLAFGGVLAGRLSPAAWDALEEGSRRPFDVELAATLAASAPTPFSALALTLLSRHPTPGPLPVMLGLLLSGEPARAIADPDAFALRWAGEISGLRPLLEKTARFSWLDGPTDPADLRAMVLLGRTLALSCAGAMRRVRGSLDRLGWRLWREALGPDMPRVLLPALGRHLRSLAAQGRLQLEPVRSGRGYEVRLPDGTALGRGSGPVQARVRALGLCAQAWAAGGDDTALVQGFSRLDPTWRALGRRLAQPRDRAARVLVVEAGSVSHAGPPFDVLNRGLERTMEFEGAVAVTIAPGRRPSGRVFSPVETVEALLQRAAGESPVELFASRPESRPMATRLGQMAALLRAAAEEAVAVEAGGRVYIRLRQGVRRYALDRFAARPRCFTPDPESPDLSAGAGERPARASHPPGMLACRVTLASKQDAAVIYSDGCGGHLRERVPLAELEEHLRETRSIVRAAHPAAVLTVRLSGDLEPEVRRAGQLRQSMPVVVRGELPWVEVEVGGERFGGDSMVGWATAAEVLLAFSRPDDQVRIGVSAVAATIQGGPATPLLSIWAASVARRRLRTRLARVLDAYREAASRRRAT